MDYCTEYGKDENGNDKTTIKEECIGKEMFCNYGGNNYGQQDKITVSCSDYDRIFICYGDIFVNLPETAIAEESIDSQRCNNKTVKKVEYNQRGKSSRSITTDQKNDATLKDYELRMYRNKNQKN